MCRYIKGIIFDLDGVITDTSHYHYLAWKRLADEINIYFDEKMNNRLKGIDRMASLEILLGQSSARYTEEQKLMLADKKNSYYRELIDTITPDNLYTGIHELFDRIKQKNIKTALASVSKNAPKVIKKLQIEKLFDAVVDANLVVKGKPDPEIFIKAADMLGLKCHECAVIEDSRAGITGAKAAGMVAVGIGTRYLLPEADVVYERTADIKLEEIDEAAGKYCLPENTA